MSRSWSRTRRRRPSGGRAKPGHVLCMTITVVASPAEPRKAHTTPDWLSLQSSTSVTLPGLSGAVRAMPSWHGHEIGRRHDRPAQSGVTPRAPMQGGHLDRDEMKFLGAGVHHGQDERGVGHRAPPGTCPMAPSGGTGTPRRDRPAGRVCNHRHPMISTAAPTTIPEAAASTRDQAHQVMAGLVRTRAQDRVAEVCARPMPATEGDVHAVKIARA